MMSRHLSAQQDILSTLAAGYEILPYNAAQETRIHIDRLELQAGHPSGVGMTLGRLHALSTVRRRRPIFLLPAPPSLLIGRSTEMETLRQSLIARGVVDVHGPDGAGKSCLAAALVHTLDLNHFPDGVVFATGSIRCPDLLQVLFDSFYESDFAVKVTPQQTNTYLRNLRVLILLDQVGLGPQQVDPVLDALDDAAVLIVGPDRTALGRGRALHLKGLPRQDAIMLFERAFGQTLSDDELVVVHQLCSLLNDMPLPIYCVAKHTAQTKRSLVRLLSELQSRKPWAGPGGDPSVGPSLEQLIMTLDTTDRQLLTLAAAFVGPSAPSEALRRRMNLSLDQFQPRIDRLQQLGLLYVTQPTQGVLTSTSGAEVAPRVTLSSAYYEAVRSWLVDDAARKNVIQYYAALLTQGQRLPGNELFGLLGAIEDCARIGALDQLKLLVPPTNRALAELRWWAAWQHLLDLTRRAAQTAEDQALEAWAMHQLGSLQGALGVFDRAFHLLETARSMRQTLGDQTGAQRSARNLAVLEHLTPLPVTETLRAGTEAPPDREGTGQLETPPSPGEELEQAAADASRVRRWGRRLAFLTALAVLVIGAVAVRFVVGVGDREGIPDLTVSWEFGDAWNAYDNMTWTQQVRIIAEGNGEKYRYYVNGEPAAEMFQMVLPICEGGHGTILVEGDDGQTAEIEYAFDSPFCR